MLEGGPEHCWDLARILSFESCSLCFFPTTRIMQHCCLFFFWIQSISSSQLPYRDKSVSCKYGCLPPRLPYWMRKSLLVLLPKTKLDIGEPLLVQHRDLGFVLCLRKYTSFSMKATAAVFSLPPVCTPVWSLLLQGGGSSTDFATWIFSCILVSLKMMFVTFSFCPWIFSGRKKKWWFLCHYLQAGRHPYKVFFINI